MTDSQMTDSQMTDCSHLTAKRVEECALKS